MTRRHDSLVPLSHDHHHALAQARRLAEAASMSGEAARRRVTDDFINFYLGSLVRHFREEEELFFAPLVDHDDALALVLQALTEHLRVHPRVRRLKRDLANGKADPTRLAELATLLTAHVRFEERDVYLSLKIFCRKTSSTTLRRLEDVMSSDHKTPPDRLLSAERLLAAERLTRYERTKQGARPMSHRRAARSPGRPLQRPLKGRHTR
jgi:hypothetical protein